MENNTKKFDVSKVKVLDIEGKDQWRAIVKNNEGVEIDSIQKLVGSALFNDAKGDELATKGKDIFTGKAVEITPDEETEFAELVKNALGVFKPWVARSVLATGLV